MFLSRNMVIIGFDRFVPSTYTWMYMYVYIHVSRQLRVYIYIYISLSLHLSYGNTNPITPVNTLKINRGSWFLYASQVSTWNSLNLSRRRLEGVSKPSACTMRKSPMTPRADGNKDVVDLELKTAESPPNVLRFLDVFPCFPILDSLALVAWDHCRWWNLHVCWFELPLFLKS